MWKTPLPKRVEGMLRMAGGGSAPGTVRSNWQRISPRRRPRSFVPLVK